MAQQAYESALAIEHNGEFVLRTSNRRVQEKMKEVVRFLSSLYCRAILRRWALQGNLSGCLAHSGPIRLLMWRIIPQHSHSWRLRSFVSAFSRSRRGNIRLQEMCLASSFQSSFRVSTQTCLKLSRTPICNLISSDSQPTPIMYMCNMMYCGNRAKLLLVEPSGI